MLVADPKWVLDAALLLRVAQDLAWLLRSDDVEEFELGADLGRGVRGILLDELFQCSGLCCAAIFDTCSLIVIDLPALLCSIISCALLIGLEQFVDLLVIDLALAFVVEAESNKRLLKLLCHLDSSR